MQSIMYILILLVDLFSNLFSIRKLFVDIIMARCMTKKSCQLGLQLMIIFVSCSQLALVHCGVKLEFGRECYWVH